MVSTLSTLVPAVRVVQEQVQPYAAWWESHNRVAASGRQPLWVALGDSMTQGIGASAPDRGWVGQLSGRLVSRGWDHRLVNLGVNGARVEDLLDRQLPVLEALTGGGNACGARHRHHRLERHRGAPPPPRARRALRPDARAAAANTPSWRTCPTRTARPARSMPCSASAPSPDGWSSSTSGATGRAPGVAASPRTSSTRTTTATPTWRRSSSGPSSGRACSPGETLESISRAGRGCAGGTGGRARSAGASAPLPGCRARR